MADNKEELKNQIKEQLKIIKKLEETIEKLKWINEVDLLNIDLSSSLKYGIPRSKSTHKVQHVKFVKKFNFWDKFEDEYLNQVLEDKKTYKNISLEDKKDKYVANEADLNMYVTCICKSFFEDRIFKEKNGRFLNQEPMIYGKPDIVYAIPSDENSDIMDVHLIIETKTKWFLQPPPENYTLDKYYESCRRSGEMNNVCSSINELHTILRRNKLKYGILTTFEDTWFFKLDTKEDLYVSKNVKPKDILKAMKYFLDQCFDDYSLNTSKPSSSDKQGASNESDNSTQEKNKRKTKSEGNEEAASNKKGKKSALTSEIIDKLLDDSKSLSITGNHSVMKIRFLGDNYTVKLLDAMKQDTESLENEAKIYRYLNEKEVNGIPKLMYEGIVDDIFYIICFEFVEGKVVQFKQMSNEIRLNCIKALQLLHDNNVLHGDIREENFLVRPDNTVSLIDYNLSSISNEKRRFEYEMKDLKRMLELN